MAAFMAGADGEEARHIGSLASRLDRLIYRLRKFSFPLVAQVAAALLLRPENHPATGRVEVLIHLAALGCRGTRAPSLVQLREWLNDIIFQDAAELEDPVEDVFLSNVATWFGNARLFDGGWGDNDYYVQSCLAALTKLKDRPWAARAQVHVIALLRLSEAVAARTAIPRFTLSNSPPRRPLRISAATVEPGKAHVTFTIEDIFALGFSPGDLNPFVFRPKDAHTLEGEGLGHTSLERRPLVRTDGLTIVALPTAIGAAVRRFIIESAEEAGDLALLQTTVADGQFQDAFHLGRVGWDIVVTDGPTPLGVSGLVDFIGRFDEGSYIHAIFVPDDLTAVARNGLQATHSLFGIIDSRVNEQTQVLATRADYRRGMTLVIHGGVGRGFAVGFGGSPVGWQRLGLSLPDFMRLGWDAEFSALRSWKLLDQEDALVRRGIRIANLNGFTNLYAFANQHNYELVPAEMSLGMIGLATDFLTPLRHRLRVTLDQHVALAPGGRAWVEVQRETTNVFFTELENLPVFVSPGRIASGVLSACIETTHRPWWVECEDQPSYERHYNIVLEIWKMARNWLVRLAPILEDILPNLPSGPIVIQLCFDELINFDEATLLQPGPLTEPVVEIRNNIIMIKCPLDYLRAFARPLNIGDRLMVAALVRGAFALIGGGTDDVSLAALVNEVVRSDEARFFHMIPPSNLRETVRAAVQLPQPRLQSPENSTWSRLGLAQEAGWTSSPGRVPFDKARPLLNLAVDALWQRIRGQLVSLNRSSVIERALLNQDAIEHDRSTWRMTAAALLALHHNVGDVLRAANDREGQRALAGLASRVVAEMALCTSPPAGGKQCSTTDLDELMAHVGTLIECASQSDALHHSLVSDTPIVNPNGSISFDGSFAENIQHPYMAAHGERIFRAAAEDYGIAFQPVHAEGGAIDTVFASAFLAEFGLDPTDYFSFVADCAEAAMDQMRSQYRLPRSEVLRRLAELGAKNPLRTFEALALKPRSQWDEIKPKGAKARDWYPWRFNRRLSLTRRPLVQLSNDADPDVLIVPTLLDINLRYLCETASGRIPVELFDSSQMRSLIGAAVDRDGHAFNSTVAERLRRLRWQVRTEVGLQALGGEQKLGDIDVLAWRPEESIVYAVECKRLSFARTVGEIGERLTEYTSITETGDRTPIQKHLDRLRFLKANTRELARLTSIPLEKIQIRSALVTDYLVPMQFSARALDFVDILTDLSLLDNEFS